MCNVNSVPLSLPALVGMILDSPDIKSQTDHGTHQAVLSISQLLQYNSSTRRRAERCDDCHNTARTFTLPLYVGRTVHARTRKRDVVETLFGLSVFYDRVMVMSTAMGNNVLSYHQDQTVLYPPNLTAI